MLCEKGQKICGFTVVNVRRNEELHARVVEMRHDRTGARLCWLDNGAANKLFSIAFKTLPSDNTGVFHILEHSLLCGSDKYPVKEAFTELLKGSMNTFLNALTGIDFTMYPVSSRNDQDLMNLAEVYLDAVFAPAILKNPLIFKQEGWRLEFDDKGEPHFKGVVYNEMKGAFDDVDEILDMAKLRVLFPDADYHYVPGGDPSKIPELTYEKFVETYKAYYHPSNAYIYLDGNVPIDRMMKLIASYLDRFDGPRKTPEIRLQKPAASEETVYYQLGANEDPKNKERLVLARITGGWEDKRQNMAREVIADVLTDANESPLKRAILERQLAEDMSILVEGSLKQSFVVFEFDNIKDGCEEEIRSLLREYGRKIEKEGLDPDSVLASGNRLAFQTKSVKEPQAIHRCFRMMSSWIYGGDPVMYMTYDEDIKALHEMHENGEMNRIAADMLLNETGLCIIRALPSSDLADKFRKEEAERARNAADAMSGTEKDAYMKMLDELHKWHDTPDSPENLEKLPMLKKEDVDQDIEWVDTYERNADGVRLLYHCLPDNGIVHVKASFRLTDCTRDELTGLSLMCGLMGELPTDKHSAYDLQTEVKKYIGRISYHIGCLTRKGEKRNCTPYFNANFSALEENLGKATELVSEILRGTRFDAKDRIAEIVKQEELSLKQRVAVDAHTFAIREALSHYTAGMAVAEATGGPSYVRYIHALAEDFDNRFDELRKLMERVRSASFCKSRMLLTVIDGKEMDLTGFVRAFPEGTPVPDTAEYAVDSPMRRGYRVDSQISYTVRAYRLEECGFGFSGSCKLASDILSLSYLWNKVRVQGGAYGTGMRIDAEGNVFTYSYRDPKPDDTLKVDAGAAEFIRHFRDTGEKLDKYIIAALNDLNPLLSAEERGMYAGGRYLAGYTRSDIEKVQKELINADYDDLAACGEWMERFASDGAVCVISNANVLKRCDGLEIQDL